MVTYYLIWLGFITVAVSDAREHRIPNYMLGIILALAIIDKVLSLTPLSSLMNAALGALIMFLCAFILFLIRAMAPGDVKLLGVVGFVAGWGQLLAISYWIAVSTVIVALFYAAIRLAEQPKSAKMLLSKYTLLLSGVGADKKSRFFAEPSETKLRMPFAPIVVIGLALHQYF
ncbi:A24 family peptidase [Vibrio sp. S4M6]|uniref:prepilin peptidase n=1 Tax=Vibrio sinus TaxID=2946865 RepID=UPI00202A627A|nr:A24 family peptidase [Vibrio sinus]MCL9781431.1 A24 family peptidase [Vibrio sinus]